jgi:hypothetical protein
MTQDEIIEMAREAGLAHFYDSEGHCSGVTDANLITAEKEKNDARLVEILMSFAKLVDAKAATKEREACAKVCEDLDHKDWAYMTFDQGTLACADAIRARGETTSRGEA